MPDVSGIRYLPIGYGQWQATLWVDQFNSPAALVWYTETGPNNCILKIAHTFTVCYFRRQGLMRYLFDRLVEVYPHATHIVTSGGTDDGGKAFLDAYGFTEQLPHGYVFAINRG